MRTEFTGRRMKRNERCERPSNFVFVDTETYCQHSRSELAGIVDYHTFRLGAAIALRRKGNRWYGRTVYEFSNTSEFWAMVASRTRQSEPVTIFAHNWHYDAQALGLWQLIEKGLFRLTWPGKEYYHAKRGERVTAKNGQGILAISHSPFIVSGLFGNGIVKLVDTFNYWQCSLAEIGRSFGVPKLDMPLEFEGNDKLAAYCVRDCEIIERAITTTMDAWQREDRGNWQPTAGMLAMSNYRHKFMDDRLSAHDDMELKKLERSAYFGGESRAFYNGLYLEKVYAVDVNSLYPSIMHTGTFPRRVRKFDPSDNNSGQFDFARAGSCIARVEIVSNRRVYPVRTTGGVRYPAGKYVTTLCGAELEQAVEYGEVRAVGAWAEYELGPIFRDFIDYWWNVKIQASRNGNKADYAISKMVMNSLVGKFGAKANSWRTLPEIGCPVQWGMFAAPHPVTGLPATYRAVAGTAQVLEKGGEREDSYIATAAFVTSSARVRVRNDYHRLGDKSVLCVRTDGLLLTDQGMQKLRKLEGAMGDGLGQWRQDNIYEYINIAGPNHFYTNSLDVVAGCGRMRERVGGHTYRVRKPDVTANVVANGPSETIAWREATVHIGHLGEVCESAEGEWSHGEETGRNGDDDGERDGNDG